MDIGDYKNICYYLKENILPKSIEKLHRSSQFRFKSKANDYILKDDKLYNKQQTNKEIVTNKSVNSTLESKYSNVPVGSLKLFQELKGSGITHQQVKDFLSKQEVQQLHKPLPKLHTDRSVHVNRPDIFFQIDLIDMSSYVWFNNGYARILTCLDVYSKRRWVIPLKNKEIK